MGVRYIGSKGRVVDAILEVIGPRDPDAGWFVDVFSGTGAVAAGAADRGWPVRINDHLLSSTILGTASLLATADLPFSGLGGYAAALQQLNQLGGLRGFIWREYSPASKEHVGHERRYFTEHNAAKIDAVRAEIDGWLNRGQVTQYEHGLLVADLLVATNKVANIAGTYGCYLSNWTSGSQRPLQLQGRQLRANPVEFEAYTRDAFDVPAKADDIAYLDPPYTKRQYAAYYHLLETITYYDEPKVEGRTGLRPWQRLASDFCYKTRALDAIKDLVASLDAEHQYLSYSNEGHVTLSDLEVALGQIGHVTVYDLGEIGRYRPNRAAADAGDDVTEYLIEIVKPAPGSD